MRNQESGIRNPSFCRSLLEAPGSLPVLQIVFRKFAPPLDRFPELPENDHRLPEVRVPTRSFSGRSRLTRLVFRNIAFHQIVFRKFAPPPDRFPELPENDHRLPEVPENDLGGARTSGKRSGERGRAYRILLDPDCFPTAYCVLLPTASYWALPIGVHNPSERVRDRATLVAILVQGSLP